MITQLLEDGYAYWHRYKGEKNVYFAPLKFKGFGKLSHLDLSKWPKKPRRFHKDTYPGTPWNMGDFVLWHGCEHADFCYKTPLGTGRPAWNIQDAAIVTKHLGFTIDVACGGIDNLVRHHDYTLAVAEAVSGKQFSRFWLHGGHLFVDGEKMSKSKGNVLYTDDVCARGFSGKQLRFFLIYAPYRDELNFTFEELAATSRRLDTFRHIVKDLEGTKASSGRQKLANLPDKMKETFEAHMNNNLDVAGAFDSLYETLSEILRSRQSLSQENVEDVLGSLRGIDYVLQCLF